MDMLCLGRYFRIFSLLNTLQDIFHQTPDFLSALPVVSHCMKYQYNLDVIEGMSLAIGYIVGSPTVYYMDKVVEQLNELLEEKTSDSGEDWYTAECLGRAIEIVKRGGRDEE